MIKKSKLKFPKRGILGNKKGRFRKFGTFPEKLFNEN